MELDSEIVFGIPFWSRYRGYSHDQGDIVWYRILKPSRMQLLLSTKSEGYEKTYRPTFIPDKHTFLQLDVNTIQLSAYGS